MSASSRIGVLGGTFDPIHLGHLDAAETARRQLQLDEVLIVPAHIPPHRSIHPRASTFHRFAMVALCVAHRPGLLASDLELQSPGPSYTSATLDKLVRAGYGPAQLFFIVGADAFAEIATWKDYPALLDRCHFATVSRPRHPAHALRIELPELAGRMVDVRPVAAGTPAARAPDASSPSGLTILLLDAPTADVSSTEIRQRIAAGQSVAGLVSPEVEAHILRHRLYSPAVVAGTSP